MAGTVNRTIQILSSLAAELANLLKEVLNRALGLVDFVGCLLGWLPPKKLRLRVAVLQDEAGNPLADESVVDLAVAEATRVFWQEAHTRIVPVGGQIVVTLDAAAPAAALNVRCGMGAWAEDFGEAGAYFRRRAAYNLSGTLLGYGAPVTAFVVRDIVGKGGCSLGILADHVTVDIPALAGPGPRVLTHEVAHACGLWHSKDGSNLMFPSGPGDSLSRWQRAILRSSRHVTYL